MKLNKLNKTIITASILTSVLPTSLSIYAEEQTPPQTPTITIEKGKNQKTSKNGYGVYPILELKEVEGKETYQFHKKTKGSLQKVIASLLTEDKEIIVDSVTEEDVIDYINSLQNEKNPNKEKAMQLFLDIVYSQCQMDEVKPVKTVKETKKDKTIEVKDISYGYYLIHENDDDEENRFSILDQKNPLSTVDMQDTVPSISQGVKKDENEELKEIIDAQPGQDLIFQQEGSIVDLSQYDLYKYIVHTSMDSDLEFNSVNAVKLQYVDKKGKTQEVSLDSSEYQVETEGLGEGETFQVSISDLKTVYKTYANISSEDDFNDYDGKVIVTYTGRLKNGSSFSPKGVSCTSYIEYSKSSTSEKELAVSKDVVSSIYTYGLSFKVQDSDDKKITTAKFKLYQDRNCKKEIFISKTAKGYTTQQNKTSSLDLKTDKNGEIYITGLSEGIYFLKEVETRESLTKPNGLFKIEIKPTYSVKKADDSTEINNKLYASVVYEEGLEKDNGNTFFVGKNIKTDTKTGLISFTIINPKKSKVPVYIIGGIGVISIICYGLHKTITKNKKESEE